VGTKTSQTHSESTGRTKLSEVLLTKFCKPLQAPDYPGGTARTNLDNALSFLLKTVPDFTAMVSGKSVLDFGCGLGNQAAKLALDHGCYVTGIDLPRPYLQSHWGQFASIPNLRLTTNLPASEQFDVVYSCSSFEHFSEPEAILRLMAERVKPGGRIVITFAEPWYSNNGSHMGGFCRLPWVNLIFSERTIMRVRSRYRNDGAQRFEEVEGGLNRMSVAKFERIIRSSGMRIESLWLWPTKGVPFVTHVPVLRELLTSACSCILQRSA
jgi:SAM-dependent methyltransferase